MAADLSQELALRAGVIAIEAGRVLPRPVAQVLGGLTLLQLAQLAVDHGIDEDAVAALHLLLVGTDARWSLREGSRLVELDVSLTIDRARAEPLDDVFLVDEARRAMGVG